MGMFNEYSIARKLGENRYKVRADRDMPIILQTTVCSLVFRLPGAG